MHKITIILVDDHKLFIAGLAAILQQEEDIEVIDTFTDANSALKKLKTTAPDLLITDISMPTMNGVEFIDKVKDKHPDLKILVASMFNNMVSRKKINGYLLKDTESSDFVKAIREIVLHNNFYFKTKKEINYNESVVSSLTKREKEIVTLITKEKTVIEIAEILFLSKHTVETHKKNIFLKLDVKTNAGLTKKALELGFIS